MPRRPSPLALSILPPALCVGLALLAVVCAAPANAQWRGGGWGGPGWGGPGDAPRSAARAADPREGRVNAEHFVADGALAALGRGRISVVAAPGSDAEAREQATYEAAIIDQLAKAGYDTLNPDPHGGQIIEVSIVHDMLEPAEEKAKPLSGSMAMGVSNHGSMMALSLNYDATKPRGALIGNRLEIRIRDRATGAALYEARADLAAREGDSHWNSNAIASRLAAALFAPFPHPPAGAAPALAPALAPPLAPAASPAAPTPPRPAA